MTSGNVTHIQSRDNAFIKGLRRLAQDNTAYRKQGRVWLEGDHLCRAVLGLRLKPVMVLVDGNQLPVLDVPAEAIVKGDALVPAISAASILAKVHRDRWCAQVDIDYPEYGFAGHKGYGTAAHLAALRAHGACPLHRSTFAPVAKVLHRPGVFA